MTEEEIRPLFRVVSEPSWRVEYLWKGQWSVVAHCKTQAAAEIFMESRIARTVLWSNMTPDQRYRSTFRNNTNP